LLLAAHAHRNMQGANDYDQHLSFIPDVSSLGEPPDICLQPHSCRQQLVQVT